MKYAVVAILILIFVILISLVASIPVCENSKTIRNDIVYIEKVCRNQITKEIIK